MLFPFIPLLVLCVVNIRFTEVKRINWGGWGPDLLMPAYLVLTLFVSVVYGLALRERKRQLKLAALFLAGVTYMICGIHVAYLEDKYITDIRIAGDFEVNRTGFYSANILLLVIAILSKVWRRTEVSASRV